MVTIKDVAKQAGVSIATVSHVLNKTRYVSQDLVDAVEEAIRVLQYTPLRKSVEQTENKTFIGVIVPDLALEYYAVFASEIVRRMRQNKIGAIVLDSGNSQENEFENLLLANRQNNICGILYIPLNKNLPLKTSKMRKPCLIIGEIPERQKTHVIVPEYEKAAYEAATYLIWAGHERIALIGNLSAVTTRREEYCAGYRSAHRQYRLSLLEESLIDENTLGTDLLKGLLQKYTAVICETERMAVRLLYDLKEIGASCPEDLSIITLECGEKSGVYQPPIASIGADARDLAGEAHKLFVKNMDGYDPVSSVLVRVQNKVEMGDSVKIIGKGPFGDKLVSGEDIYLTGEEIQRVRQGNYRGVLLFQFSGKRWMRLIEQAVRTVFEKLNIQLMEVFDAASNSDIFKEKVGQIMLKKPDFLICAAANDKATEDLYRDLSKKVKMFFIGRVPKGLQKDEYECCVVSNEEESGYNCAKILSDYFLGRPANIGLLTCSSSYISGKNRDVATKKAIEEQFPNLKIVVHEKFTLENYAYEACRRMVKECPNLQGIYVTWEDPAIQTISALMDEGREDIKIVTGDLDTEVAQDMARNHLILGVSAQMPYQQAETLAYAAANVLLGKEISKVYGITPLLVTSENLEDAWYIMTKERIPRSIAASLEKERE